PMIRFDARRLAIALCALALAATPVAGTAADPFEIPAIVPLTGPGAFLGKNEAETLQLVEKQVNANGGVRGRPIKFVITDDATNPQVAVQLTNAALAKNPSLIFGGTLFASCLAMAPIVKNALLWCFSPGIDPQPGGNV